MLIMDCIKDMEPSITFTAVFRVENKLGLRLSSWDSKLAEMTGLAMLELPSNLQLTESVSIINLVIRKISGDGGLSMLLILSKKHGFILLSRSPESMDAVLTT